MVADGSGGGRPAVCLDMEPYGDGDGRHGVQRSALRRPMVRIVVAVGRVDVSAGDCRQTVNFDKSCESYSLYENRRLVFVETAILRKH